MAKKSLKNATRKIKELNLGQDKSNIGMTHLENFDWVKQQNFDTPKPEQINSTPTAVPVQEFQDSELEELQNLVLKELQKINKKVNELEKETENQDEKIDELKKETENQDEKIDELEEELEESQKVKDYKKADKINEKDISSSIADKIIEGQSIGGSIKQTISDKTKASFINLKKKFDPLNIAKSIGGPGAAAIAGRALGRKQGDIEYFAKNKTKDTASKIKKDGTNTDGLVDILNDMYGFMKKNREDDIMQREEEKSKEQDKHDEKEKRHKELLEAISKLTGAPVEGGTASKEDSGGLFDSVMGIIDSLGITGAMGAAKKMLGKGAVKGAAGAAEGLAEGAAKSATKLSKLAESAKGVLKFLEKIPGLSYIAAGAALIYDVKTAIDKHDAGEISDQELKKEVVSAVGGGLGGLGGAEVGALLGGAVGSVVPVVGTSIGGLLGGFGGFFGGEKLGKYAAEKMFDFFADSDAEPPADPKAEADKIKSKSEETPKAPITTQSTPSIPTASPAPTSTSSSAAGTSAKPTEKPSSAIPTESKASATQSPNSGVKLVDSTKQNQNMKLAADTSSPEPTVVNNSTQQASAPPLSDTNKALPPVRNKDDTLERLMFYSTRVV